MDPWRTWNHSRSRHRSHTVYAVQGLEVEVLLIPKGVPVINVNLSQTKNNVSTEKWLIRMWRSTPFLFRVNYYTKLLTSNSLPLLVHGSPINARFFRRYEDPSPQFQLPPCPKQLFGSRCCPRKSTAQSR